MADDTQHDDIITEENTAPDLKADAPEGEEAASEEKGASEVPASDDGTEVAKEQVDFTMAPGITEAPESSSDGTMSEDSSADSTTSPSPMETKPESDDSDEDKADEADDKESDAQEQNVDALKSLSTEDAEGEGPTHTGTDTPKTLVSHPADPCTGRPLDGSNDLKGVIVGGSGAVSRGRANPQLGEPEALPFDTDNKEDKDAGAKLDEAIGILGEVRGSL